jgi:hypothetical protein
VAIESRDHLGAERLVVLQQPQRRVQGRDQQGCRHPLAGDVGDDHHQFRGIECVDVVVVAPHVTGGTVPAQDFEAASVRQLRGQQAALDVGREVELPLESFLLQRVAV